MKIYEQKKVIEREVQKLATLIAKQDEENLKLAGEKIEEARKLRQKLNEANKIIASLKGSGNEARRLLEELEKDGIIIRDLGSKQTGPESGVFWEGYSYKDKQYILNEGEC